MKRKHWIEPTVWFPAQYRRVQGRHCTLYALRRAYRTESITEACVIMHDASPAVPLCSHFHSFVQIWLSLFRCWKFPGILWQSTVTQTTSRCGLQILFGRIQKRSVSSSPIRSGDERGAEKKNSGNLCVSVCSCPSQILSSSAVGSRNA